MPVLTIRKLDEATKARLKTRAASHGRSVEEEAREILKNAVTEDTLSGRALAESIRRRLEPVGGVDLDLQPRQPMPERVAYAAGGNS